MKEVEEGKKARESQQQLNHLNSVVLRLSTLLEGSDGHRRIWLEEFHSYHTKTYTNLDLHIH